MLSVQRGLMVQKALPYPPKQLLHFFFTEKNKVFK